MRFPSALDFLEKFGIEPIEEDPSMAFFRYNTKSRDEEVELEISFSGVAKSFQIILRCGQREIAVLSSENVASIEIRSDKSGEGIYVIFDIAGVASEAWILLEPDLNCRWWTLRTA